MAAIECVTSHVSRMDNHFDDLEGQVRVQGSHLERLCTIVDLHHEMLVGGPPRHIENASYRPMDEDSAQ